VSIARTCCSGPAITRRRPAPPILPGLEVAGTIVAIGSDVKDWKIGDQVMALVSGGGYADTAQRPRRNA
jgi:NADPH:quinone reductase-like Zn-dependent oxidoreductase